MKIVDYRRPKKARKVMVNNRSSISGRFKLQVVNPDGSLAEDRPWQKNLILDQGLNQCCDGTASLASAFTYCAVGTGTTPTYTDSGAITVNITAGTATASASFFTAGMVGMLLVADTGEEQYITGFTSDTIVSVSGSESVVAQLFTVWAVNQTGLGAEVKRTNTYLTGSPNCGTTNTVGTGTRVLKRTFDFTAEVSPQNYEELGWSYSGSAASNLFSRVLITGGTVTVLASQQLRVIYELTIVVSPISPRAEAPTITGWPVAPAASTDGDYQLTCPNFSVGFNTSYVETNGTTNASVAALEPWFDLDFELCSGSTIPSFGSAFTCSTSTSNSSSTVQSYTGDTFYRDIIGLWLAANGDRTDIRAIKFGDGAVFVFDEAQTKDSSHLLEITWRRTLGRTLTNP